MDIRDAYGVVESQLDIDAGRFYGPSANLNLGVGLIYDGVQYAVYNAPIDDFMVVQGLNYILTHECDVEKSNVRPLNDYVLICPVIPLEKFVCQWQKVMGEEGLKSFLSELAKWKIHRLIYFPIIPGKLPHGGILYLNFIANTHYSIFEKANVKPVCALSGYGLTWIDKSIERHLLRPKDDNQRLPLT